MAKAKATHKGECQICGHCQKLPGGRLSKHGYTKRWGFFSGICNGAGELPFEQSKDLIEAAIQRVETQKSELENQAKIREASIDPLNVVASVYIDWKYRYQCLKGHIEKRFVMQHEGRDIFSYWFVGEWMGAKIENQVRDGYSLESNVKALNQREAWRLRQKAEQIKSYILWQRERLKNWKVRPLTPVGE